MQPYGVDNGADIPLHTSDRCLVAGGYFYIESFGYVDKQLRVGNRADDAINCVTESHVSVIDAEAPEQVTGFFFVLHTVILLISYYHLKVSTGRGSIKRMGTTKSYKKCRIMRKSVYGTAELHTVFCLHILP